MPLRGRGRGSSTGTSDKTKQGGVEFPQHPSLSLSFVSLVYLLDFPKKIKRRKKEKEERVQVSSQL